MAVSTLFAKLFAYDGTEKRPMPPRSGVVNQLFSVEPLTALTTAGSEGAPASSGTALTEDTKQITLSNFTDFISVSNVAMDTHLVDVLEIAVKQLAYRAALGVDNITTTALDVAADGSSSARIDIDTGSYMTAAIARQASSQLENSNVSAKEDGYFYGLLHTSHKYDLINDNTAAGFADLMKYSDDLASKNPALVGISKTGYVGVVGGVKWYASSALPSEDAWQSGSHTAFHSYVLGWEAAITSSLGQASFGQKNFKVFSQRYAPGTNSIDPAGKIAAAAAVNYYFGVATAPGSTPRFIRIRAEGSKS
jgi:N4-gp56 family major capsid protein